jgi:hypothetical protein
MKYFPALNVAQLLAILDSSRYLTFLNFVSYFSPFPGLNHSRNYKTFFIIWKKDWKTFITSFKFVTFIYINYNTL